MSLPHADVLHVAVALGWLDLYNSLQAADELARIAPEARVAWVEWPKPGPGWRKPAKQMKAVGLRKWH